ncbi:MAG: PAS domain S-box protein [Desulfobacteraceae bacterium]|nr:PAS domain S-box protein [Desulfobacteraceae bacterium]
MKKNFATKEEHPIRLGYYLLGTVALWSILIGLSLAWNLRTQKSGILEAARIEARTAFDKDVVYRRWNTSHGGVYAPVTGITQPNPYLDVPERDIATPLGKELTNINPAYMTRQVHELALKAYGIRGHITSLNPIRPANAPDPWETQSLKAFQTGLKEVSSVEEIEGNDYMRLMRPLLTEKGCLQCHAAQGYKLGDIRGGISVSIPMAPHMAIAQSYILALCVGHLLLWLAGLVGIGFGFRRLNQQIHKRIGVEEVLRESEKIARQYLDIAGVAFVALDNKGNISLINQRGLEILGHQREELLGKNWFKTCLPARMADEVLDVYHQLIRGEVDPVEYYENPVLRKDGTERIIAWHNSVLRNPGGEIVGILSSGEDITNRLLAEEALQQSEEKYRQLSDSLPQIVFETDEKGNLTFTNRMAFDLLGYTKEDFAKGLNALQMLIPEDRDRALKNIQRVLKGEKLGGTEYTMLTKDGRRYPAMIYATSIISKGKSVGMRGIIADLTEVKRAQKALLKNEEKLARSRKMESLGLLAGGVAHDLNNILSGIVSYPELLLMDLPENSSLRKPIKTIQESGMRAADVVEDLLTIARGVATGKEALNLNTIVTEYLGSPEYHKLEKTHSFVSFKTDLDADLLNMRGSPTHIKKTLMNLVTNASEAIEGSGTVTISTANRYLDEPFKGYEDVRTGEYVLLNVSDDGSGISSEDLERIFEPFYTKNVMGRMGTGLGLAVVWNCMQDHNGYINVKSSEKGTVFELFFPVTREEVAAEEEEVPLEDYLGHGEKILVVDDEERQREIASGILAKLGYNPEAVSSGEEAIEYVKEHPVDLLVLDMVMPKGINGRKAYEEIIKINPGQKAIIASGYAKTKEVDLAQDLGAGKYIKKPYTLAKIGLAVKEELEK